MDKPYKESGDGFHVVRVFESTTQEEELVWHYDKEDRIVVSSEETDWMIQMDNELPKPIEKDIPFLIKEGVYHRLIKGNETLVLEIWKDK